jgi:hypothetical protein
VWGRYVARNVWPMGKKLAGSVRSLWLSVSRLFTLSPALGVMLHWNTRDPSPAAHADIVDIGGGGQVCMRHLWHNTLRVAGGGVSRTRRGRGEDGVWLAVDDGSLGLAQGDHGHLAARNAERLHGGVRQARERIAYLHRNAVVHICGSKCEATQTFRLSWGQGVHLPF